MRFRAVVAVMALAVACASEEQQAGSVAAQPDAPPAAATAAGEAGSQLAPAPGDSVLYLDVRTAEEYRTGHVQGSVLLPYDEVDRRWQELEAYRDRPVVVYCRTGRRAGIAIDALRQHGFSKLENGGGVEDMAARGLNIVRGDE